MVTDALSRYLEILLQGDQKCQNKLVELCVELNFQSSEISPLNKYQRQLKCVVRVAKYMFML